MPAPWSRRPHAAEPVTPLGQSVAMVNPVPPSISWQVRPGDTVAHAYSTSAGWMRSVCRAERWTVALDPAPADLERCNSCAILVDGSPGEISEAFGS